MNLLNAHGAAENLILVINSADYEEKYFRSQLDPARVHESSTNAKERYVHLKYLRVYVLFIINVYTVNQLICLGAFIFLPLAFWSLIC